MTSGSHSPRFLAVLPARGGSKRIPRKNVRPFHGVPLIARTIQTVLSSGVFQDVIVSTDDAEIARVAREHGALVPFIRPPDLADDYTPTAPVIIHALDEMSRISEQYDAICCVYPGAVLMTPEDFRDSSLLVNEGVRLDAAVAAVVRYGHPIQRALERKPNGLLAPVDHAAILKRTQDLQPAWHDAGQFYWASAGRWKDPTPMLTKIIPYELPSWRAQDIDNQDDWDWAEIVFEAVRSK